jgi:hypothetical protein
MTNSTAPTIHRSFKAQASHSDQTGVKKDDVFKIPPHLSWRSQGSNERDYDDPRVVAKIESSLRPMPEGNCAASGGSHRRRHWKVLHR